MTAREILNFVGLALGITASFAWTALLGFALTQLVALLL
jgi:hypothetical protein